MKKNLLLLSLIWFASVGFSQELPREGEIERLVSDSFDAIWSGLDTSRISDYYTDDFLLLEDGEVWDNDAIMDYLEYASKNPKKLVRKNRFEFISTEVNGDMAWVAYHNHADFFENSEIVRKAHWLESAVAVKTPAGWRLRMLHSTPLMKE